MRMHVEHKVNNKIKKSHILIIGSLLVFLGVVFLSWNYLEKMKGEVYSDMRIALSDVDTETGKTTPISSSAPVAENISGDNTNTQNNIDYSKYLGVLEIPKIGLKRGFYGPGSRYNNIKYNVTMIDGSNLPDVSNGNLILIAHSGDAYISFFAYLYRLNIGDSIYVTYNGVKYHYSLVNIYNVPKNGLAKIERNHSKTSLTLITCTKNDSNSQTIYISELVE